MEIRTHMKGKKDGNLYFFVGAFHGVRNKLNMIVVGGCCWLLLLLWLLVVGCWLLVVLFVCVVVWLLVVECTGTDFVSQPKKKGINVFS